MTLVVALRFAKLLAVMLFAGGTAGAFLSRDLGDRRRAAFLVAAPGFVATWILGFAMRSAMRTTLATAWIAGAAITSTIAVNLVLWAVAREGRRGWLVASASALMLIATMALMIFRPGLGA